ncbi:hypothetical protein VE03_06123 [Pseudogymnoascus sp. 23342-1-I1]|nr:hypothetical protein VE03_06123 [Pseudogymnoascus sp. 23342-1-I1]
MGVVCKKRKIVSSISSPEHFDPTTGACSIELYLANKEPFRVAPTSRIPVPQPYDSEKCSEKACNVEEDLHDSIVEVANSFGITCQSMSIVKLWERGLPNTAKDTLVISTSDTNTTRWEEAANYIYNMLEKAASSAGIKMEVEIQNPNEMYNDVSVPIRDDDICRVLDIIKPALMAEVDKNCGTSWTSIAYHCRKRRFPENREDPGQPAIIIFVNPGSMAPWGQVEERTADIIDSEVEARRAHDDGVKKAMIKVDVKDMQRNVAEPEIGEQKDARKLSILDRLFVENTKLSGDSTKTSKLHCFTASRLRDSVLHNLTAWPRGLISAPRVADLWRP